MLFSLLKVLFLKLRDEKLKQIALGQVVQSQGLVASRNDVSRRMLRLQLRVCLGNRSLLALHSRFDLERLSGVVRLSLGNWFRWV